MTAPAYPCLLFDQNAVQAAQYYCSVFRDCNVLTQNSVFAEISINGGKVLCLNGGSMGMKFNESMSIMVICADQEEIDEYWNRLVGDGGQEGPCGWLKDKYGCSWQIVPQMLMKLVSNPEKMKKAMEAFSSMKKLDIAGIEKAMNS